MTSTLLRSMISNSNKRQISAQELLTLTDTVIKSGLLRKKGKKLNIGKWPHRFVILTYDTVYVYDHETSKVPKTKFGLIGYNKVARCDFKGQHWCFSVIPADDDCGATKTFSCVSDADRKDWMRAIKNQMYTANSISKPSQSKSDTLKQLTNSADEYISIETLVYSPAEGIHTREENDFDNDDGDQNSDGSFDSCSGKVSGSSSNTKKPSLVEDTDSSSDSYESYDGKFLVQSPVRTFSDSKNRSTKDPPPPPPLDESDSSVNGNQSPPSYISLDIEEDDSSVYVNAVVFKQPPTLESMCTITDSSLDHTQLMNLLLQRGDCGTYLIRKSRQGDQKVIAILSQSDQVKEYKIYGTVDRPTLDQKEFFTSIEELLHHYTAVEPLPKSSQYLKQGIFKTIK